jgi:hypothetical protein
VTPEEREARDLALRDLSAGGQCPQCRAEHVMASHADNSSLLRGWRWAAIELLSHPHLCGEGRKEPMVQASLFVARETSVGESYAITKAQDGAPVATLDVLTAYRLRWPSGTKGPIFPNPKAACEWLTHPIFEWDTLGLIMEVADRPNVDPERAMKVIRTALTRHLTGESLDGLLDELSGQTKGSHHQHEGRGE